MKPGHSHTALSRAWQPGPGYGFAVILVNLILAVLAGCSDRFSFEGRSEDRQGSARIAIIDGLGRIEMGRRLVVVDANRGGRIVEFSLDGRNVLVADGKQVGSTFWTSPQSAWDWPPPAAIDREPYAIRQLDDRLELTSKIDPRLGIRVSKILSSSERGDGFEIRYVVRNMSALPVSIAAWEVSRVAGGITFFPSNGYRVRDDLAIQVVDGIAWYRYRPGRLTGGTSHKSMADGSEGWIANANPDSGLMLVKTFPNIEAALFAPGEAEIELYASPEHDYMEIEQQGAYSTIPPGSEIDWKVVWHLHRLEDPGRLEAGNTGLVTKARSIARQDPATGRH